MLQSYCCLLLLRQRKARPKLVHPLLTKVHSTSGTNQTLVEIPKGINFLAFGKDPVCSFKSSINSLVNGENSIDLLQNISFSLLDHTSSTLKDATKGRVPQTDLVSSEISGKNQSAAESIKLSFYRESFNE
ncbi:hypothetical protein S245_065996 [Arachis hypogaea]